MNRLPEIKIGSAVREHGRRVARRVDELLGADPMLLRRDALSQARRELSVATGSPAWERDQRRKAQQSAEHRLQLMVSRARGRR